MQSWCLSTISRLKRNILRHTFDDIKSGFDPIDGRLPDLSIQYNLDLIDPHEIDYFCLNKWI
ncbi:hypothetical protein BBD46_02985 [Natrialba sp. SSL1]|nr:hypothetical protein BBD46_02985 [Natrialba sp. SSL1]